MKVKLDGFVLAIIAVVTAAYFFPQWGSKNSNIPLSLIGSIGISLIFFFYGLKLSPEKIKNGLKNWNLHALIQLSTFLLFPLIILIFYPFIRSEHDQTIWLAFLFLAALPSTVSSSVVMVSMAKGNIPAAIFNASISGLIGIVITPLWMGLFLKTSAGDFSLGSIYIKLITEILVPVMLGIALQRYLGKYVQQYSRYLSLFDKSIILLIIYKSFAESFEENIFTSVDIHFLAIISAGVLGLFCTVYFITGYLAQKLNFNQKDSITAQFCGTKKSLVHGTVFSKILFPASIPTGIILLPLMLFHAIQIFIISIIASKLVQEKSAVT
ncbi:MAG TPA: bile acid:sodium symporter family protein [Daejeonella sp.]|nr:bile acid:sodium symporter family protein [Daejeonella sp.]